MREIKWKHSKEQLGNSIHALTNQLFAKTLREGGRKTDAENDRENSMIQILLFFET